MHVKVSSTGLRELPPGFHNTHSVSACWLEIRVYIRKICFKTILIIVYAGEKPCDSRRKEYESQEIMSPRDHGIVLT